MMIWHLASLSTSFESYLDDEGVIRKDLCNEVLYSHLNSAYRGIQTQEC